MEKIEQIFKKQTEYNALINDFTIEDLHEYFKKYFDELGDELVAIDIAMSTPGFNDGDPCYNSMHEPKIFTKTNIVKLLENGEEEDREIPTTFEGFLEVAEDYKNNYDELDYGPYEESKRTEQENRLRQICGDCHSLTKILEDKFGTDVGFFITKTSIKQREVYDRG